jgi:hypothetical protein
MATTKLDNPKYRHKVLETIRKTGMISQGYKVAGISEATLHRYRQTHPEFNQSVMEAVQYYKVQQEIEYSVELRKEALAYYKELLQKRELNHAVLHKFLFEHDHRKGC